MPEDRRWNIKRLLTSCIGRTTAQAINVAVAFTNGLPVIKGELSSPKIVAEGVEFMFHPEENYVELMKYMQPNNHLGQECLALRVTVLGLRESSHGQIVDALRAGATCDVRSRDTDVGQEDVSDVDAVVTWSIPNPSWLTSSTTQLEVPTTLRFHLLREQETDIQPSSNLPHVKRVHDFSSICDTRAFCRQPIQIQLETDDVGIVMLRPMAPTPIGVRGQIRG